MRTLTNGAFDKIKEGLAWLGIEATPGECEVCEDGSAWHGLTQVLPPGTLVVQWDGERYYVGLK